MWSANGPAWGPWARAGPGPQILNCFAGRAWTSLLRAGPGPGLIIQFAGLGRVCTTAAGPGRAWASNHVCGPGLGLDFRPVQGPSMYSVFPLLTLSPWDANVSLHLSSCISTSPLLCSQMTRSSANNITHGGSFPISACSTSMSILREVDLMRTLDAIRLSLESTLYPLL